MKNILLLLTVIAVNVHAESVDDTTGKACLKQAVSLTQQLKTDIYPDMVVEGRDIGTAVFPDADIKIYLQALPGERAKRRQRELKEKGHQIEVVSVERDILKRDKTDSTRATGPLAKAADACVVDTTEKTIGQVVQEIIGLAKKS